MAIEVGVVTMIDKPVANCGFEEEFATGKSSGEWFCEL